MSNSEKKISFEKQATIEIAKLLTPLKQLDSPTSVLAFLKELGWEFEARDDVLSELASIVSTLTEEDGLVDLTGNLSQSLIELLNAETDEETIESILNIAEQIPPIVSEIDGVVNHFDSAIVTISGTGETGELIDTLLKRLIDYLVYVYLETYYLRIFAVCKILGILEIVKDDHDVGIKTLYPERIPLFFSDPLELTNRVYKWNSSDPDEFEGEGGERFLDRLALLLRAFQIPGGKYKQGKDIRDKLGRPGEDADEIRIPLYQTGIWPDQYLEFDVNLSPIPPSDNKKSGLLLYPYFLGHFSIEEDISEDLKITLKGNTELQNGLGIQFRAPHNLEVNTSLFADRQNLQGFVDARLELTIRKVTPEEELSLIFGSEQGSHFGYADLGFQLLLSVDGERPEIVSEFEIEHLTLAINPAEVDGFIQKILSGINLKTSTDLAFGYSNLDGAYFRGSGALDITIPIHETLGPVNLKSAYVGMGISDDIEILLGVSFGAEIGPVSGNVEQIGLSIPIGFSENNRGNLGPLDVKAPSFMPPKSVGLVVAAGPITGGGFLEFDPDNERYSGMLQLQFEELGLTAIGLITTRMPDGSDGFSMLISIMVEFSPPIQLSFGFTLSAVGGLVGINRTMKIGTLRDRIRNGTIDSILFPRNPIQNAQRIISDLRTVMPPEEDRFIVGPMVRIGYGSPNFITGEIALMIELPEPVRIALLGQISAFLPEPDETVVELHIDVLGTVEPPKQLLSIDATIYDSRILTYTLTGDMALRLKWGDNPVFAISLGGFHPKFSPPPNFPSLRRLRLSLGSGNNPRFNCDAYHALTSNSLQFGSRLEVYAKYSGANFKGHMGFDALFYFSPFSFEAAMSGGVAVRYKGKKLASVRMELYLSGPTPWFAEGTASFEILVWEVDVHFEKSWGPSAPAELEALNPEEKFIAALHRPESWGSTLPEGVQMVESLRSVEDEIDQSESNSQPKPILIHPSGSLEVHQNVLPLDIHLDKFGNTPIAGNDIYDLDVNSENGVFHVTNVEDYFARGQFQELSNNDKVSKPSYELFKSGISIKSEVLGTDVNLIEDKVIEYESDYIDEDFIAQKAEETGKTSSTILENLLKSAAVKKSSLRKQGKNKYARKKKINKVNIDDEAYKIVNSANMTLANIDENSNSLSRSKADEILRQRQSEHDAELMIVPEFEVAV